MRISTIHENAYDGFIDLIQVQVIFVEIDALVCQLNQSMIVCRIATIYVTVSS
jgi:hypothetical protein